MHHETQREVPRRTASAKPPSEAERQLNEMIAREARMERCFRCYHVDASCDCPPGKGLRGHREAQTVVPAATSPRRRTHAPR